MAGIGFWSFLRLLQLPRLSSVSVISGTGDSPLGRPSSCEPQIRSASSLVYVEQGEAVGLHAEDRRHLPVPKEGNCDENWTEKL